MRVSLKAVPGVDSVNVSLKKGLATVTMKPSNTTTLKQLQDAVSKNGFTMKQSEVILIGKVQDASGKLQIQVSGSNDILELVAASQAGPDAKTFTGKTAKMTGEIPESQKGKIPGTLRYKTIEEQR